MDFVPSYASNSYHLTESTSKTALDNVTWIDDLDKEYCYYPHAQASRVM